MVLVCLPSDALSQHLPSYLGFSYLGRGVSLHGCSSKVQPLLLTLHEEYLLTAAPPDLERGVAPLSPPGPAAVAPWRWGCSSRLRLCGLSITAAALLEWVNLTQMTIISTTVGRNPLEETEWPSWSTKESEMQYLDASGWQNDDSTWMTE